MRMKTRFNGSLICTASIILIVAFISCSKNEPGNNDNTNKFTWTYESQTYNANVDTAYISSLPFSPVMMAGLGTRLYAPSPEVIINLNSFNPGTYVFSGSNVFNFTDPVGNSYQSTGGSLTISKYSNYQLSGTFSVMLPMGKTITGSFTDVPVKP